MNTFRLSAIASTLIFLVACGGGGGSDTTTSAPTTPTTPTTPTPPPDPTKDFGPIIISSGELPDKALFLRGSFNDWSTNSFVENDGILLSAVELNAGTTVFKIADRDWQPGTDCGLSNSQLSVGAGSLELNCSAPNNGNISLDVPSASTYTFAASYDNTQSLQVQVYESVAAACEQDPEAASQLAIHYLNAQQDLSDWQLVATGDALSYCVNHPALLGLSSNTVETGQATWQLPLVQPEEPLSISFRSTTSSNTTGFVSMDLSQFSNDVWIVEGIDQAFASREEADSAIANLGNQSRFLDLSDVETMDSGSSLPADWAQSANFMEIYVRGYQDSDGDGVGDLQGLISRLDYLEDLGITGIWLMPVHESTDNDHGYQVEDYRDIEDDYGSIEDFQQLLTAAHSRGIGIIIDYLVNHSSNINPLFLDASFAPDNSKRDWFIFADNNPGWSGFGGASWHQSLFGYYYGVFFGGMPDFNLRNQQVIDFHHNNLRYWLNMGVDGFRFDATGVLIENGANAWEDQEENHHILQGIRETIDAYQNRFLVCESPADPVRYAEGDSCQRAFAFGTQFDIINSAQGGTLRSGLVSALNRPQRDRMPMILSNHDSFAGERMGSRFGSDEASYRVAAATYILASSTPFTYYGEEVGMANGNQSGDHALRTPMSWTADPINAGFSSNTPFRGLAGNAGTHNVEVQAGDPDSLLNYYKSLYQLRLQYPVLALGDFELLSATGDRVLAFSRENAQEKLAVLVNLSIQEQSFEYQANAAGESLQQVFPAQDDTWISDSQANVTINIPAKTAFVIRH